jgi:hypothetical protein
MSLWTCGMGARDGLSDSDIDDYLVLEINSSKGNETGVTNYYKTAMSSRKMIILSAHSASNRPTIRIVTLPCILLC